RGGGRRWVLRGRRGGRAAILPVRLSGGGGAGVGAGGGGRVEASLLLGRLAGASARVLGLSAHDGQAATERKSEVTKSPSSGAVKARVRRAAGKQSTHRRRDKGEQLREKGKQRNITLTQELAGRPLPTVLWRP